MATEFSDREKSILHNIYASMGILLGVSGITLITMLFWMSHVYVKTADLEKKVEAIREETHILFQAHQAEKARAVKP